MWADVETEIDFLNYSEVAELAAGVLRDPRMRPLSVGIFGTWGTGKSTLLNLVEKQLSTADDETFIIVRFDAWLYQGYDDSRAALMEVIASKLLSTSEVEEKTNAGVTGKAVKLLKRVNRMRVLGLLAEGGAALLGIPTFGLLSKAADSISKVVNNDAAEADYGAMLAAEQDLEKRGKDLINPEAERTAPKEIAAFREEFSDLLSSLNRTLVVFVDNLDRCLPKQTIHTLEALRLFLFMDRTAFVIAADEDMVRHSVAQFFKDPRERHVIDYLDKLIQVPIRVSRIGVQEVRAYLFLLFASAAEGVDSHALQHLRDGLEANMREAWKEEPMTSEQALLLLGSSASTEVKLGFAIADRVAPLLANSTLVEGNPRIVKRMLNVVRMRSRLATLRKMPVDEALVAKLALFERCTSSAAVAHLYTEINQAAGGKPGIIALLEDIREDPDQFSQRCPEQWAPNVEFIREWLSLEPLLGAVDLRPVAYLSRETIPLRALRSGLSAAAAEGIRLLLRSTNSSSPSAKAALVSIPVAEHAAAMSSMIDELRKHGDWRERPPGFNGAMMLANVTADAGQAFGRFLRTVNGGRTPPWYECWSRMHPGSLPRRKGSGHIDLKSWAGGQLTSRSAVGGCGRANASTTSSP